MKHLKIFKLIAPIAVAMVLFTACGSTSQLSKCPDFKTKNVDKTHKVQINNKSTCSL